MDSKRAVLGREIRVINIGIERFSEDLKEANVPVELLDSLNEESDPDVSE